MNIQLDSETILAFTQGDKSAFSAVYNRYYDEILYFTHKLTSSKEEAEDITIEIFLKLFKIHDRFTNEPNIKAFLYITARNNCLNYFRMVRQRKTYRKDFSDVSDNEFSNDIEDQTSQHAIIESLLIKEIYEAVEELPDKCRQVFKMIYIEGLETDVIALQLSISTATVRSQKRHALELLRVRFSDNQLALALILALSLLENSPILVPSHAFA
jgi:RNA polymerase sigma-19 factor, ECF subfamily